MNINDAGLELIKSFEGLQLTAYVCPAGVWKIGCGHTSNVKEGSVITKAEAEKLFLKDLRDAESTVTELVTVKLNENEFSALVSFVFNVGSKFFSDSILLKMLNNNDRQGAADQFLRSGLARRRVLERRLFLS
jgi:GH24 family phage-related lysozyme (muramidase)